MEMTPSPAPETWGQPMPMSHSMVNALRSILRMLESARPTLELLHSFHFQLIMCPELAQLPAMQRFSEQSLKKLHACTAAAGFLRRILGGETGPDLMRGLRQAVREMYTAHKAATTAFTELERSVPETTARRLLPIIRRLLAQLTHMLRTMAPAVSTTLGFQPDVDPPDMLAWQPPTPFTM